MMPESIRPAARLTFSAIALGGFKGGARYSALDDVPTVEVLNGAEISVFGQAECRVFISSTILPVQTRQFFGLACGSVLRHLQREFFMEYLAQQVLDQLMRSSAAFSVASSAPSLVGS